MRFAKYYVTHKCAKAALPSWRATSTLAFFSVIPTGPVFSPVILSERSESKDLV